MNNKQILPFLLVTLVGAQQSADQDVVTRQLWDATLQQKRPAVPGKPTAIQQKKTAGQVKGALVGVTFWNMRRSKPEDTREIRAMIHEESGDVELTPERLSSNSPLKEGQRVRISVESAEAGYLYIIDRDLYADGTKSPAYLIFPTTRTRGGDGYVKPGMVVEIPAQEDSPSHFTIRRSRPDQVNETLTILVSPKPIPGLQIGRQRLQITDAQVALWEKQWQAKTLKLEAKGQEGKAYTVEEKQAGGGKLLTSSDVVPQTMYQVENRPGEPVLLQVPLRIK